MLSSVICITPISSHRQMNAYDIVMCLREFILFMDICFSLLYAASTRNAEAMMKQMLDLGTVTRATPSIVCFTVLAPDTVMK